jgi:phenylacetate-CoA ligase
METLGATVLVCTPSYALHLLQVARERGIDVEKLPVRITVHAGEPGAGSRPCARGSRRAGARGPSITRA